MLLLKTGTIKEHEFIGTKNYPFPNGTYAPRSTFLINSIELGSNSFHNIRSKVSGSLKVPLVLGLKAIEHMGANINISTESHFILD